MPATASGGICFRGAKARALELGPRAGRKKLEKAWKALRQGWYVGGEGFAAGLLKRVKEALSDKRRKSNEGRRGSRTVRGRQSG